MDGASQTADEDPTKASSGTNTDPGGVLESDASVPGATEHQGHAVASVLSEADLPGLRSHSGRSIAAEDVKEVIGLLDKAGVPACVAGVYALRYYGAGRISNEWDICVPDEKLDDATVIFENDARFERATPAPLLLESLRHTRPTFVLKGVDFVFILVPASDYFIDPSPDCCELSNKGIPYPKMPQFARSLLVLQNTSDLCDFIDGMDLDRTWGESNVDFDDLQLKGLEFTRERNAEFEKLDLGKFKLDVDYRSMWNRIVDEKEKRIEPMKKGRYKTRWRRVKNDMDPRLKERPI
ncbi:hypothetical protein J7T55_003364 [Diaporthe amygdali]|uniref:uncharacterized protein n=1 Tax=Phomopsis amygdali TaxID=1214568 RepID=UPI0022FF24BE|nr:uncharacterized protein J7T55_003364 [Diaporthe amygdali]KAJ0116950.1 hypothetical protein J7T55_003364 [Diaporthe amygdali]